MAVGRGARALALCAVACLTSCRDGARAPRPASAPGPLGRSLLELSFAAGQSFGVALPSREAAEEELIRMAQRARERVDDGAREGDEERLAAFNRLFFEELAFAREVDDRSLRFALLPAVLAGRRGSCLGLAGAYLALGELVGLPLRGVLVPGHFFVRHERHGATTPIELLKRGRAMPRRWYEQRYRVPQRSDLYLRSLTAAETLAVFRFQNANEHRLRGEHRRAVAEYRAVLAVLPGYAEAHGNLGLTLQHLGEHAAAAQAYARAAAIAPQLEGLAKNREALRRAARDR